MSRSSYTKTLQQWFAHYGFPDCPLTDQELAYLWRHDFGVEQAYSIGCDVSSGFAFNDCAADVKERQHDQNTQGRGA